MLSARLVVTAVAAIAVATADESPDDTAVTLNNVALALPPLSIVGRLWLCCALCCALCWLSR